MRTLWGRLKTLNSRAVLRPRGVARRVDLTRTMFSTRKRRAGWLAALFAVASLAMLSFVHEENRGSADDAVMESLEIRQAIADTQSLLVDSETGQRSFLLTNDEAFLYPYERAR